MLVLTGICLRAQDSLSSASSPGTRWIDASASLGLSSDFYTQNGQAQSRLPASVHRGTIRANVTLFEQIELPFEAYFTTNEYGYRQPFNQFGVSPRFFGWLQFHAGYFSMRLSELTFGDSRLLGGGIELSPKNFRLGAFYGYTREARNPDPTNFFVGEYRRKAMGFKIGYGDDGGAYLTLNTAFTTDDSTSIRRDSITPTPQENLVTSLSFGLPLFDNVFKLTGEFAVGAFTSNTQAPLIDSANRVDIQESVFTANISTNVDAAARAGIMLTPSQYWNIRADVQWIGPGFVTLGYVQLPNDVLDITLSPSLRLFENKLFLRASIGKRSNNLRNTRQAATQRTIGSFSASMQFTNEIGMDVQYSNFGVKSTHRNDTIRVQNISQLYSFSPRANFEWLGGMNTVSLSASFQNSEDQNQFTAQAFNNTTSSYSVVHSISLPSTLSFTTTAFSNSVKNSSTTAPVNTTVITLNETVGYSLLERMLSTNATLGVNFVDNQGSGRNSQFMARLSASLNLNAWGTFTVQVMNNNYDFATASGQPNYSEYQGSLQYNINF